MKIFASDHMVSVEIMIASGHFSQTFMGISHNNFRRLELFSRFQDPAKFFFVDTHDCTDRIKLVQLCLSDKVSGIYEMHSVNFALLLSGSRRYQS